MKKKLNLHAHLAIERRKRRQVLLAFARHGYKVTETLNAEVAKIGVTEVILVLLSEMNVSAAGIMS